MDSKYGISHHCPFQIKVYYTRKTTFILAKARSVFVELLKSGASNPSPSPETNIHHQVEYLMKTVVLMKHVKFNLKSSFVSMMRGPL